ncbi:hypothetical protein QF028_004412 [Neobacillus sp. B4I6]|uniref:hypothetical protein n=1 Tax=Neobacillus sp. B4I6 TaxID=3373925 RepID=UPI003D1E766C
MINLSICLLVWLFIGFIGGLKTVLDKDFDETHKEVYEKVLSTFIENPKNPKLFAMCLYTITGPYWIKSYLKNKKDEE